MNKKFYENKKTRSKSSPVSFGRKPVPASRKPIVLTRQLIAPARRAGTESATSLLVRLYNLLIKNIQQFFRQFLRRRSKQRKLALLEIQQLGEKRFIAIVRVGKQKFLIGGAATSVSLLAEINAHNATLIPPRPLDQETA
ncbi:MAG: hypothetical protein CXZ00_13425 [Acidobacteria bacterium]|nr:MAG: hypothetical protein CXZ00_13425 [Acidobacteriota bacterium]